MYKRQVYEPELYREVAEQMNEGELPIYDWVYLGLYRSEAGMCAYTYGLQAFGKREMEVLDSAASPQQLHDFLYALASYVLDQDVTLNDGETIGFSAEEKLPITCGPVSYTHLDVYKRQRSALTPVTVLVSLS